MKIMQIYEIFVCNCLVAEKQSACDIPMNKCRLPDWLIISSTHVLVWIIVIPISCGCSSRDFPYQTCKPCGCQSFSKIFFLTAPCLFFIVIQHCHKQQSFFLPLLFFIHHWLCHHHPQLRIIIILMRSLILMRLSAHLCQGCLTQRDIVSHRQLQWQ